MSENTEQTPLDKALEEIAALRKGLSDAATNIGNGTFAAPYASLHFLTVDLPEEIKVYCESLRNENARLKSKVESSEGMLKQLREIDQILREAFPSTIFSNFPRQTADFAVREYQLLKKRLEDAGITDSPVKTESERLSDVESKVMQCITMVHELDNKIERLTKHE